MQSCNKIIVAKNSYIADVSKSGGIHAISNSNSIKMEDGKGTIAHHS